MALSATPPYTTFDRTLPKPISLLPTGTDGRRSSSLLQHHISSDQFLTPAADESGRRNTVPCLARPGATADGHTPANELMRQRQASVMSGGSNADSSSDDTSPAEGTSGYCLCVRDPKIPRPRNAFILYRQAQHAKVVSQNPQMPNPEISKVIGEQWQGLSSEEKDEWKAFAEQEKARHAQQFPNYRYRPKRNSKYPAEGASQTGNQPTNCAKCGGKTMNPPHTPHYPPYEAHSPPAGMARPPKRPYPEAHIQPRQPSMVQVGPPPHPTAMRYPYAHRDSVHYPQGPPPYGPSRMPADGPDAKGRRIESPYATRPSYDHQFYKRERASFARDQHARHPMPPPGAHRPSQAAPLPLRPLSAVQPRRDPSLTLPPLKTGATPRGSTASSSQKAGIEAVILAQPVLEKLKMLRSITPSLANPSSNSPPFETRGAIIAIEGLDPRRVYDMTQTLADQLEKEGKFLVRTFQGPDPYEALASSRRAHSQLEGQAMTADKYLRLISDWHKVSKDLIHFITHKPTQQQLKTLDQDMSDTSPAEQSANSTKGPFERGAVKRFSPVSAVSPGTVESTANMQLDTPKDTAFAPRSRVPVGSVASSPQTSPSAEVTSPKDQISDLIPVALVPHYQLTTVDACSIALPISDNYDPQTHWRWHATIWRGCVGPDISVVIKPTSEQLEDEVKASERKDSVAVSVKSGEEKPAPASAVPVVSTTIGVDVRLQDHRAVIVRAGPKREVGEGVSEKDVERETENWEKAKRRVGFEVEEWMRR